MSHPNARDSQGHGRKFDGRRRVMFAALDPLNPAMPLAHQTAREPFEQNRKSGLAEARRRLRLLRTGVALAILISGSGLAIAHQVLSSADRVQAIADDAALAGLHALVGINNRVNLSRFDDASKAAHRVAENDGVAPARVTPFADGASFSVALNAPRRAHDVVATARYVRPGQRISEAMGVSLVARLSGDE
jgi:hypothetical protein